MPIAQDFNAGRIAGISKIRYGSSPMPIARDFNGERIAGMDSALVYELGGMVSHDRQNNLEDWASSRGV